MIVSVNFYLLFFILDRSFIEGEDDDEELEQKQAPLCLNSDISYFGVGGKQAVFFIGNSTRVGSTSELFVCLSSWRLWPTFL